MNPSAVPSSPCQSSLGSGRPKPLFHPIVVNQSSLLEHHAASGEDCKVRDTLNVKSCSESRIFLRVDL